MSNLLKMAQIHSIQTLRARGWSYRRIGRELGIHRETVRGYVLGASGGGLADAATVQNRPNPPTGSSGPRSQCEPWRQQILEGLCKGLSAQRIWQDLRSLHGFAGGYDSVKRFCHQQSLADQDGQLQPWTTCGIHSYR